MVTLLLVKPVGKAAAETLGSVLVDLWNRVKDWPAWTLLPIFMLVFLMFIGTASSGLTPHTHDKYSGKEYPT